MVPVLPMASIVRFDHPWWLVSIAAAGLPTVLAVLANKRGRNVSVAAIVLQTCAILAIVAAMARPSTPLDGREPKPWLLLRDVSGSVRWQVSANPQNPLRELSLPEGMPVDTQNFAASLLATGRPASDEAAGTLIAPALRLARAREKAGNISGAILLTDGQFHDESWRGSAAALGASGVDFYIVPLDSPPTDARIADFHATRSPDGRCELSVTVAANAPQRRTVRIVRLRPAKKTVLERTLNLIAGDTATLRHEDKHMSAMADVSASYEARIDPADAFPENDSAATLLLPARRKLCVVAGADSGLAARLAELLKAPVAFVKAEDAPRRADGWADYSAVLLLDGEGDLLDAPRRASLAEYVRDGGGLVHVGAGPRGSPEDRDDPLNRVAALIANPAQRRSVSLIVVLDASGSMSQPGYAGKGQVKFDVASQALLSLRRHLSPGDALTVIAFSDKPVRLYAAGAGAIDFAAVRDALAKIRPSGSTRVIPAIKLAADAPPAAGSYGLILLLSDLRTERADANNVLPLATLLENRGYSLAVVAVGSGENAGNAAPLLIALHERLDKVGKVSSSLIRRDRIAGVAKVFANMLRKARGDAIRRGTFTPTVQTTLFGLRNLSPPKLDAYILCASREGAEVLGSIGADPIIARRTAGLGRSVTLAVPLGPPENNALRAWEKTTPLLAAAVQWAMKPAGDPRFTGKIVRSGRKARLRIVARDAAGPMNSLELLARIRPSRQEAAVIEIALSHVGPGRYVAELPDAQGPAGIIVSDVGAGGPVRWRGVLGRSTKLEYARIGADWENLRRLETLTGGRIVSANRLASLAGRLDARRYKPLWMHLVILAAVLMLTEWATLRQWRKNA